MEVKVTDSFRRKYLWPALVGTCPIVFRKGRAHLSGHYVIYSLLLQAIFSIKCCELLLKNIEKASKKEGDTFHVLFVGFNTIIVHLSIIVSFLAFLWNGKSFRWVLGMCSRVERDLCQMGVPLVPGYTYLVDIIILITSQLPAIVRLLTAHDFNFSLFFNVTFISYECTVFVMTIYPFLRTADFIRISFCSLKQLLIRVQEGHLEDRSDLTKSVQLHSLLCTVAKVLNKCFSFQLLFLYSVIFTKTVTCIYNVIRESLQDFSDKSFIFMNATIVILAVAVCVLITWISCITRKAASEFSKLLYQVMIDDKHLSILTIKKLRLHIAMNREVVFTACGFFSIDNTIIHSMIAAATTYLVILLQSD